MAGGHHFQSLTAGEAHTCALDVSGGAWCWGSNWYGELGRADAPHESAIPVFVGGGFFELEAGAHATCGVMSDGTAWCWGRNAWGNFGNGTNAPSTVPTPAMP